MSLTSTTFLDQSPGSSTWRKSKSSAEISRVYKEATALYLTRRLAEALSTIQPLVSKIKSDVEAIDGEPQQVQSSPIAYASQKYRVKVWCFYLTLLNAIAELDPEEGREAFGLREWKSIVAKSRDGSIWDEVVDLGYGGVEGAVDIEVVNNLASLLLARSSSQKATQDHLETYLSVLGQPSTELAGSVTKVDSTTGVDSLKDLENRIQMIELYALHVLPRNDEWEYAREFLAISDILDEEVREAFLQTLKSLEEEKGGTKPLRELEPIQEPGMQGASAPDDSASTDSASTVREKPLPSHAQLHSERDYGIEGNPKQPNPPTVKSLNQIPVYHPPPKRQQSSLPRLNPSAAPQKPKQTGVLRSSATLLFNIQRLTLSLSRYISQNPLAILRFVLFLVSLIAVLGRRDVKDRLKVAWDKLKRTLGMGIKATYI